jgi:hypothetical protein
LVKSKKTRKNVKKEVDILKHKSIHEVNDYLRKHNLTKIGSSVIKGTKENIQITLKSVYQKFLKESFARYGKSKTFFYRDSNVSLNTFYVPLSLKCDNIIIKTAKIKALLSIYCQNKRMTIIG